MKIKTMLVIAVLVLVSCKPDLFEIIDSGDMEAFSEYIESDRDLDILSDYGETPTIAAINKDNVDILETLISKKGLNIKDGVLLEYALEKEKHKSAAYLNVNGAKFKDGNLLDYSIKNGRTNLAIELIENGIKSDDENILIYSIENDLPRVAIALIKNGYDVHKKDSRGITITSMALDRYDIQDPLVETILEKNSDITIEQLFAGKWVSTGIDGLTIELREDKTFSLVMDNIQLKEKGVCTIVGGVYYTIKMELSEGYINFTVMSLKNNDMEISGYISKSDSDINIETTLKRVSSNVDGAPELTGFIGSENIPVDTVPRITLNNAPFGMTAPPSVPEGEGINVLFDDAANKLVISNIDVRIKNKLKIEAIAPGGNKYSRTHTSNMLDFIYYDEWSGQDINPPAVSVHFKAGVDFIPGVWNFKLYIDDSTTPIELFYNSIEKKGVYYGYQGDRSPFHSAKEIIVKTNNKMIFIGNELEPNTQYNLGLFNVVSESEDSYETILAPKVATSVKTDVNGNFTAELDMKNDLVDGAYLVAYGIDEFQADRFRPSLRMDPEIAQKYKKVEPSEDMTKLIIGSWEDRDERWGQSLDFYEGGRCYYQPYQESDSFDWKYVIEDNRIILSLVEPDGNPRDIELLIDDEGLETLLTSSELEATFKKVEQLYTYK